MTQPPKLPTTPLEKIIYLLDHWELIHDPDTNSPFGRPGNGTNTPHLPGMAHHHSVQELDRCLHVLKREQSLWHDHLKAYHCAEWRIRTRAGTRKRKGGKQETIVFRDRHRATPQWVQLGYVRSGQHRLVELYVGEVFIPQDLWDALTLSSDEIEAKARRRRKVAA